MKRKKSSSERKNPVSTGLCYVLSVLLLLGVPFFGSKNKSEDTPGSSQALLSVADASNSVSVDQLSELYIVAEIANNASLSSSNYLNMDYISASAQYSINQTAATKIEKNNIIDTSALAKGVVEYEVAEGESMETIADNFGVSTDQIRWSNGLKTTDISAGDTLFIPSVSGIVYTLKSDDDLSSLAEKYGSSAEEIELENNLAARGASEGLKIVIPNGVVPETERPEYVAPTPVQTYTSSSSTTYYRTTLTYSSSNPMPWGWCTWFAWQWRYDNGTPLPKNLGNARYWDDALYGVYSIDRSPAYGDVFVDESGYYGHVGIVTGVHDDGSIEITDMNGRAGWGQIGVRDVEPSEYAGWSFIHGQL